MGFSINFKGVGTALTQIGDSRHQGKVEDKHRKEQN